MSGQRVGYIRVSTEDQNTDRQLDGIELDKVFTEKISGKDTLRPKLLELIAYVREGDTVLVHSMDRLARNLDDLRKLVKTFRAKGVTVQFMQEGLSFDSSESAMAQLLLSVMGAFAEFERALTLRRQREGIYHAKLKGKYKGRKPSLPTEQIKNLKERVKNGEKIAKLAKELGVSRQSIYRYISEKEENESPIC